MKIIKRSGSEVTFDIRKIMDAVSKANMEVVHSERLSEEQIETISNNVESICKEMNRSLSVEEIQDLVENQIMNFRAFSVARKYITYRYKRALVRKSNSTDKQILSLLECNNEEVKQENSNKNPTVNSVQRDYMAGEVSKDITKRFLLPPDIVDAHEQGLIHFHDADYFAQHMHNCCLVNLEDMLQNGTVISETMIEKPHSFSTACNIATQAIAQIASSQYGGQSISLAHLAPFVQVSREKFIGQVRDEFEKTGIDASEEKIKEVAELRVKDEIKRGVQMIQYQVITLMTTNGQAPFVTVFMYIDEVPEGQTRDDLALVTEEVLRQRMQGVKNEQGVYVTPAFPKLIYVLDENMLDVPINCLGELFIAGESLGVGYIDETMDAEKFINVYTKNNLRMYRTGDLVRWLGTGNVEFIGRIDNQVKINGFRIELSEIDNVILKNECIDEVKTICNSSNGNNILVTFIKIKKQIEISEIRKYISQYLPYYMIPTRYVIIDEFPYLASGKIDVKKLILIQD